jgi:hypothetical protein
MSEHLGRADSGEVKSITVGRSLHRDRSHAETHIFSTRDDAHQVPSTTPGRRVTAGGRTAAATKR